MSTRRFTADEVATFLRGAFTGEGENEPLEDACLEVEQRTTEPDLQEATIELVNGQQFRMTVVEMKP